MARIYVVDNGGQWTHREWRVLRDLDVDTKIILNTTPFSELKKDKVDGIVLSGGAPRIGTEAFLLGKSAEYLKKADFPILGICVGHQFIAMQSGAKAGPAEIPEYGKAELVVEEENDLFRGLPKRFTIWESHNDEIKELPDVFIRLAYSDDCKYQAIKHRKKPLYGVQFHPEVEHTEHGYDIFRNFIRVCEEWKSRR